jgi:hypothetical protein
MIFSFHRRDDRQIPQTPYLRLLFSPLRNAKLDMRRALHREAWRLLEKLPPIREEVHAAAEVDGFPSLAGERPAGPIQQGRNRGDVACAKAEHIVEGIVHELSPDGVVQVAQLRHDEGSPHFMPLKVQVEIGLKL